MGVKHYNKVISLKYYNCTSASKKMKSMIFFENILFISPRIRSRKYLKRIGGGTFMGTNNKSNINNNNILLH